MKTRDVMTRDVRTCRPESSLADAARIMWENDCGVVPVTDAGGRLVGVVTDRDICMAAYTQAQPISGLRVSSAMGRSPATCHENEDLARVEATMGDRHVRRVPVVDSENRVVGIVSIDDLALHALEADDEGEQLAVAATLGEICRHAPSDS